MSFVLDASIALAWCFADEETSATKNVLERLENESAFVPSLWPLEIGNILLSAQRRQRISFARATAFLSLISALNIQTDEETASRAFHDILLLAHAEKLTTYDATYLELAMRRGLPLATKDHQLAQAALRLGVELI